MKIVGGKSRGEKAGFISSILARLWYKKFIKLPTHPTAPDPMTDPSACVRASGFERADGKMG